MRFTREEHIKRKMSTVKIFDIKKDDKGRILNPECLSVVSQSFKDSCDGNKIVDRYLKKGILPDAAKNARPGRFGDFTNVPDFQEAQNRVIRMNQEFMALPPQIRAQFENNPAKLIDFINDPKNKEEAVKMGLLPKPVIKHSKIETPEGSFWITTKDEVEVTRTKIETPKPSAPGA